MVVVVVVVVVVLPVVVVVIAARLVSLVNVSESNAVIMHVLLFVNDVDVKLHESQNQTTDIGSGSIAKNTGWAEKPDHFEKLTHAKNIQR